MALLRTNRSYRLLFSASAVSNLGDGISALAFPWLATLITRDPVLVALVAFAQRLPWLLFSIPVGVVTDRYDRRTLIWRADVVRMVLNVGVVGLVLGLPDLPLRGDPIWAIAVLSCFAFALGTAEVVRDNAAQTVLPALVAKADLERANGQMWTIEEIMGSFIGPPLAGVLIAMAVPVPFGVDALAFGLSAVCVWMIALPTRAAPPRRKITQELREGWAWMRNHPTILRIAIMLGLINGLGLMVMTILVLFSQDVLGLDAVGHGFLLTCGAVGAVIGGMIGPAWVARFGGQVSIPAALVLITASYVGMALTSQAWVTAVSLALGTMGGVLWNVVTVSYRQRRIPDALLGRVNAIYRFFGWGAMPIGALLGGWIAAAAEPDLGREAALRLPIILCAIGHGLLLIYARARLRL
ncbi:MFS transporter [Pseudooctadecabacter jejudonensis]|uniref:Enterobactin exporter EntS n=1 Tax=Pseudooctadecabacter jejudonensis TaxID=1391910 RepID=A0A1Y5RL43_9RHOB|nr:MFS transporter [Pseudooctadecabacter jejudonensis]SLN20056.1 enterobactin exporter EntS [Pseudooctadecabacter jejudonensis]